MNVSARNVFKGQITGLVDGAVNAEVELTLPGGDKIVAIVTEGSVKSLGLALGGVRNEEEAAASLGVNPDHYKVFAFGIGTFIAGMTGSVYAH
ncbi:MAG: TOBE domain-containing protein, partial [Rhodocyclales bacterium]|nr:TOBE domain-containing protein [Rhodocyclales bacterium]